MALNVLIFWNYSLTDMFLVCVVPCTWFILRWWCIHHAVIRSCRVKCLSDVTGSSAVRRRDVNVSVSSLPVVGALPSMFGGFFVPLNIIPFLCIDAFTGTLLYRPISPQPVVFIMTVTAIYSLGHGLCTLTAVPRSTQPSTLHETVKWVSAYELSNNNKWR